MGEIDGWAVVNVSEGSGSLSAPAKQALGFYSMLTSAECYKGHILLFVTRFVLFVSSESSVYLNSELGIGYELNYVYIYIYI